MTLTISSCQDSEEVNAKFNIRTVHASFESEATRVGIEQAPDSRDMITKWQAGDKIHVFVSKGNNIVDIGSVPVHDISADGKSCVFQYAIPDDFDPYGEGFDLICFTENCDPKIEDGDIYYQAALTRMPISQFKAPLMFETYVKEENSFGAFRHYGTYEIMHVSNNTDKAISFQLSGFNAPYLWYKIGGGAIRQWDNSYVVDLSYEAKQLSAPVTIPAHSSDMVVSWYMPTGQKIEGAQITANIDGKYVYSSNTISSQVTLCTGIAYHMYATWDGKELKFKNGDIDEQLTILKCPDNHHPHLIDLGLPSGTKWACCNVDTDHPENQKPVNYGGYYAWGETEGKSNYEEKTYAFYKNGTYINIGDDIAGTNYDVAHVKWGSDWIMPTHDQIKELWLNCSYEHTTINGVSGYMFKGTNGNSIFLPCTGFRSGKELLNRGSEGYYSSSTPHSENSGSSWGLYIYSDFACSAASLRSIGHSVRPVENPIYYSTDLDAFDTPATPKAIDLGLPSGTKWANVNVGAQSPSDYGGYYAWGETEEKDEYSSWTYCYNQSGNSIDIADIAGSEYDVAHVTWGGKWRMPTYNQIQELIDNCSSKWTITVKGVKGIKFTGPNGRSIFMPAAGLHWALPFPEPIGNACYYWTSTKKTSDSGYIEAYTIFFEQNRIEWLNGQADYGQSVRPVSK